MSDRDVTRATEPHDRLTRLCAAMTDALEAHPEARGDERGVLMLQDGERGGIVLHGYDDETRALVDLFMHLGAIFRASGKELRLMDADTGALIL